MWETPEMVEISGKYQERWEIPGKVGNTRKDGCMGEVVACDRSQNMVRLAELT